MSSSAIRSRGALRPSFALLRPDRGADGAPRGAPGVGPHAYRVAWGALARRRSNPAPRDDRLLALQPWRLFSPGSPPSLTLRRASPAIGLASAGAALFQLARGPGRREPGSPAARLRTAAAGTPPSCSRRRPSNEQG